MTKQDKDLYIYVQNLISSRRFHQAISLLEETVVDKTRLISTDSQLARSALWIRYLAAKCYTNLGQCPKALDLLYDIEPTSSVQNLIINTSTTFSNMENKSRVSSFIGM